MALRLKIVDPAEITETDYTIVVHRGSHGVKTYRAELQVFFRSRDGEYDEVVKTNGWWESVPIVRPE